MTRRDIGKPGLLAWLLTAAALVPGCGTKTDDLLCASDGCFFSVREWSRASALAGLPAPPPDPSNRFVGNEAAVQLGWRFYFETGFSGNATLVDSIGRTAPSARSALGTPTGISCASCHNPSHAGADTSSSPGHVSVGAGWYDVNGQQTVNAAYYKLLYWNGRSDSLWGQAAAVIESRVSVNGNRLAIVWTVADKYRAEYDALVPEEPLPVPGKSAEIPVCTATPTIMPPDCPVGCQLVTNIETGALLCQPRFPAKGKPGTKAGCQAGDTTEPFGDAFDCMAEADRGLISRAYVNVAKVIGAYEYELRSRNSPFDQYVALGADSTRLSDGAKRGLKLFVGRASCIDCHDTPLLSDGEFHDIGVPQTGPSVPTEIDCPMGNKACDCVAGTSCLPWGYYDGLAKLKGTAFSRKGVYSDDPAKGATYASVYETPPSDALKGAWRTPSLRDVALTGPYMHDGVYRTLDEVIDHYDRGGGPGNGPAKATELRPLLLGVRDRADLIEFLRSLTGVPDRPELHVPPAGGKL